MLTPKIDIIKELAWEHAHELSKEEGKLVKKSYKKSGLKTFYLDTVYKKDSLEDPWVLVSADGSNFVLVNGYTFITKDNLIFNVKE